MPEWLNGTVSKTVELVRVPRVRISLFPLPIFLLYFLIKLRDSFSLEDLKLFLYYLMIYPLLVILFITRV